MTRVRIWRTLCAPRSVHPICCSGYAGGSKDTATYEMVCSGVTGHAEAVEITFDSGLISFRRILEVYFFVAHDPTQRNRQGPDTGTQYRSGIFYTTDTQRESATAYIRELDEAKAFARPIMTTLEPLAAFYPAETYHQHFVDRNPDHPYVCQSDRPTALYRKSGPFKRAGEVYLYT
jgi:peptide-methionine (S)-S-oxide reductase